MRAWVGRVIAKNSSPRLRGEARRGEAAPGTLVPPSRPSPAGGGGRKRKSSRRDGFQGGAAGLELAEVPVDEMRDVGLERLAVVARDVGGRGDAELLVLADPPVL